MVKFNYGIFKSINLISIDYDINSITKTLNTLVNYESFNLSFDSLLHSYKINANKNFQILNENMN